jgi:hypothetical protein
MNAIIGSNVELICSNQGYVARSTVGSNEKLAVTGSKNVVIVIFGSNNVVRKSSTTTSTRYAGRGSAANVEEMVINCSKLN